MQKEMKIKQLLILAIAMVMLFVAEPVSAQIQRDAWYSNRFASNNSTIVDLESKYSNINIQTWEKDSVIVDVHVVVSESTEAKAESRIREVQLDLSQTNNFIVVRTMLQSERRNAIINELSKIKENVGVGNATVEIEMNLIVPSNLALQISNKFGNIYLEDFDGDLKIDLSNGKLKANAINGYGNIRLNFSDAIIDKFESGRIEVFYGDLNLGSSNKLRINSKTSDVTISEVAQLTVNSTRDNFHIRSVGRLETQSSFTDCDISELLGSSKINMSFGDLSIERIASNFADISIESKSANINLNFLKNSNFNFDITTNRQVEMPTDTKMESSKASGSEDKSIQYFGKVGNVGNEEPRLTIKSLSGNIVITKR